jgi:hypothetical protein
MSEPPGQVGSGLKQVRPLGVFGPIRGVRWSLTRDVLEPMIGQLDVDTRIAVSGYLRQGTIIAALMTHTRDVINDRFGVPGGSALTSDGRYYWRAEAADYVAEYGIGVDGEAIVWMGQNDWTPPSLDSARVGEIDSYLYELFREN